MNLIVIPCRMESSRFPGKPLAKIAGKSLLHHTYDAARQSLLADKIIVTTDSQAIVSYCISKGIPFHLCGKEYWCGTQRTAGYAYESNWHGQIISLQVDEPLITGEDLDNLFVKARENTLRIHTLETYNYNTAKLTWNDVLVVKIGYVTTFQRYNSFKAYPTKLAKHIGVYAFNSRLAYAIANTKQTQYIRNESLEQLSFLNPVSSHTVNNNNNIYISINTPEDVLILEEYLEKKNE